MPKPSHELTVTRWFCRAMVRVQVAGRHRDAHVRHRHHERQRDGRRNCETMWESILIPAFRRSAHRLWTVQASHSWLTGETMGERLVAKKKRAQRGARL